MSVGERPGCTGRNKLQLIRHKYIYVGSVSAVIPKDTGKFASAVRYAKRGCRGDHSGAGGSYTNNWQRMCNSQIGRSEKVN